MTHRRALNQPLAFHPPTSSTPRDSERLRLTAGRPPWTTRGSSAGILRASASLAWLRPSELARLSAVVFGLSKPPTSRIAARPRGVTGIASPPSSSKDFRDAGGAFLAGVVVDSPMLRMDPTLASGSTSSS
eukprot:2422820-Pyramimonas_sp.AAC.1